MSDPRLNGPWSFWIILLEMAGYAWMLACALS